MSEPQKGAHTDLYQIKDSVDCIAIQLDKCGIALDDIFNNAPPVLTLSLLDRPLTNTGVLSMSAQIHAMEGLLKNISLMKLWIRDGSL